MKRRYHVQYNTGRMLEKVSRATQESWLWPINKLSAKEKRENIDSSDSKFQNIVFNIFLNYFQKIARYLKKINNKLLNSEFRRPVLLRKQSCGAANSKALFLRAKALKRPSEVLPAKGVVA